MARVSDGPQKQHWATLSTEAQDAVIKKRLEVDERPFKRLVKCVIHASNNNGDAGLEESRESLDTAFELYNHTLRRLELLLQANSREVRRYESEVQTVTLLHEEATREIARLKDELLLQKKAQDDRASYDAIAETIQKSAPKTRKSQKQIISKLEEEVTELELEKANYNAVWQTRKSGFDDIMQKLAILQHEISGEKADAELRDAADSDEEEGAVSNLGGASRANSPPGDKGSEAVQATNQSSEGKVNSTDADEMIISREIETDQAMDLD